MASSIWFALKAVLLAPILSPMPCRAKRHQRRRARSANTSAKEPKAFWPLLASLVLFGTRGRRNPGGPSRAARALGLDALLFGIRGAIDGRFDCLVSRPGNSRAPALDRGSPGARSENL